MKTYAFHTAYTQLRELYGVELNPDEFETLGLIAWDKIGNKQYKWYKYQVEPTEVDGQYFIDLPCNCDIIEAVTADYEDYQKTSSTTIAGNNQNAWVEAYIETRKFNTNFSYSAGKFVKYTQEGNTLHLADNFDKVNILYKGIIVDDTGLPFLNVKEIDAIAAFCAYSNDFKQARMTKDQATLQMAQLMEQQWLKKCTQARVPDYLNQNEMDEILNVGSSWDRKRFGRSFKPIR